MALIGMQIFREKQNASKSRAIWGKNNCVHLHEVFRHVWFCDSQSVNAFTVGWLFFFKCCDVGVVYTVQCIQSHIHNTYLGVDDTARTHSFYIRRFPLTHLPTLPIKNRTLAIVNTKRNNTCTALSFFVVSFGFLVFVLKCFWNFNVANKNHLITVWKTNCGF